MSRLNCNVDHPAIRKLEVASKARRNSVTEHGLYAALNRDDAVVTFMEHHVIAVWDFMSLLKSLQRNLTCTDIPWVPSSFTASRRLINEIVLVEESDEFGEAFTSHFELYVESMRAAGANCAPIEGFIGLLRQGIPVPLALSRSAIPKAAVDFATSSWGVISEGALHTRVAAFAFGRENLIPEMFAKIEATGKGVVGSKFGLFRSYIARHIAIDEEKHKPMALQMLVDVCGDNEQKWLQCEHTVNAALSARAQLWSGVLAAINSTQ